MNPGPISVSDMENGLCLMKEIQRVTSVTEIMK